MQRRQVAQAFEVLVRDARDALSVGVVATVHDAVRDDGDVALARDLGQAGVVDERAQQQRKGVGLAADLVADLLVPVHLSAAACVV